MANPNKSRYIKLVIINSVNDLDSAENTVNAMVEKLRKAGGAIVSIVPHNFGVNPINLIYNIIYESDHAFTEKELK